MFRRTKFQLPIAWAVLFAVLFNLALPTLAAVRTNDSPLLAEICTSTGTKKIVVPGAKPVPATHANLLHDGHCQLCPVGTAAIPLPDAAISLPLAAWSPERWTPAPSVPDSQHNGCLPPPSHAPPVFS